MKKNVFLAGVFLLLSFTSSTLRSQTLRPPAVPLVTIDPFTSCWSMADHLYDDWPRHWTKRPHSMCGLISVDGAVKRFMGVPGGIGEVIPQTGLRLNPTQSIYTFSDGKIQLTVTFTSPLLPDDLDLLSRPASYVTFEVVSADNAIHDVRIYFDATAQWAVNSEDQQVEWKRADVPGMSVMLTGTVDQKVLQSKGDDHRIDWGYLYVAVKDKDMSAAIGDVDAIRASFASGGKLPGADDGRMPRAVDDHMPGLCMLADVGRISGTAKEKHLIIGYDDVYSVVYFGEKLKAWWRRDDKMDFARMVALAESDYEAVMKRCADFDGKMIEDATKTGGTMYADLCRTVFRQAVAAHKLVADPDGKPLFFSKENNSNGSIGTVDVTYPSTPLFLMYNAELVKGMLQPIFHFRESGRWLKNIAPHDVGTYPIANGQTYGADMPVEECGNMIILCAAIAQVEGNAGFAASHWEALTEWADYLKENGFDPENQLCTDDFAGHLARNANLSIKAILAIGCYGKLAGMQNMQEVEHDNLALAKDLALKWMQVAGAGDHFSLTFDNPGSWSQKYNLVWDGILGLNLFPPEVAEKEIAYYLTKQNKYGLPLDSRKTFTKSDWILWTATLAKQDADFRALIKPVWDYLNDSPDRIPVSDWHETTTGKAIAMYARSVVGGYFMKMFASQDIPKKCTANYDWSSYRPPRLMYPAELVPTSEAEKAPWKYTEATPPAGWYQPEFDDSGWKEGKAPFGKEGTPGISPATNWESGDIWLRRDFTLENMDFQRVVLRLYHDEDAEVYINGVQAATVKGWTNQYKHYEISAEAVQSLHQGLNRLAVHCHQTGGGQGIDTGLDKVMERQRIY
jgi:hypothetical protein